jgi:ADP-heptose:LPS heptosyltransferase
MPNNTLSPSTVRWDCVEYMTGKGLQISQEGLKFFESVISIGPIGSPAGIQLANVFELSMFTKESLDFIYTGVPTSHENLRMLMKLIKREGYLIVLEEDVKRDVLKFDGWDLVHFDDRDDEAAKVSFYVFKKIKFGKIESYANPKPAKTALVVRYGAFGDLMQASSVFHGLKQQGYHVTVLASLPGVDVITNDPNVDEIIFYQKDIVPNHELGDFWDHLKTKYDHYVNLSESVEGTFLALKGRSQHQWCPKAREAVMNYNYIQFQHELAGVPHVPKVKFFPTVEEQLWAKKQREIIGGRVIVWSLKGSSPHKVYPHVDEVIQKVLDAYSDVKIVLVGGPDCLPMEEKWDSNPRVVRTVGKWPIRFSLAFTQLADLVIGPETGLLNAVSGEEMPKICFLSHSTVENLTRDWVNTESLYGKNTVCPGRGNNEAKACHQLHHTFEFCKQDEKTGLAQCQVDISSEETFAAIQGFLNK